MGPGGSQEAEYALKADVPAGTYTVVCDAVIIRAVDVTFDLVWRRGATDTTLATWTQHFEPLAGGGFDAQAFIPNGDGALANGRIPNITLPP